MTLTFEGEVQCGSIENKDTKTVTLLISDGPDSYIEMAMSRDAAEEIYNCLCATFAKESTNENL